MNKLKLNIQYFGSTNKTTHYDLSQYVASDKPTYLIDYNQDMAKIDAGIYAAMSKATVNESNIGTMQDLNTTAKSSLVLAINELNTLIGANTSNISTNTSNIATLGANQGDLVNLMTVAKNNLVSAINELKGVNDNQDTNINKNTSDISTLDNEIKKLNLVNFNTYSTENIAYANCSRYSGSITVASNTDYSVLKIYGNFRITTINAQWGATITLQNAIPQNYRPSEAITINPCGVCRGNYNGIDGSNLSLTIKTDGDIDINVSKGVNTAVDLGLAIIPFIIFVKNFGDNPDPSN